jgi:tRNA-dihydrouridine synthase
MGHAGVTFISVHARTPAQRKQPADHAALALLTSACPNLPLVANGDVNSLEIAERLQAETNCQGKISSESQSVKNRTCVKTDHHKSMINTCCIFMAAH